jgi:hypothetical protein
VRRVVSSAGLGFPSAELTSQLHNIDSQLSSASDRQFYSKGFQANRAAVRSNVTELCGELPYAVIFNPQRSID